MRETVNDSEKDVQHIPILLLLLLQLYPIRSAKCLLALAKTMLSIKDDEIAAFLLAVCSYGYQMCSKRFACKISKNQPTKTKAKAKTKTSPENPKRMMLKVPKKLSAVYAA